VKPQWPQSTESRGQAIWTQASTFLEKRFSFAGEISERKIMKNFFPLSLNKFSISF